jgi:hypothetical protein
MEAGFVCGEAPATTGVLRPEIKNTLCRIAFPDVKAASYTVLISLQR